MSDPSTKRCFLQADRPCDLTCKAAFEVDDPVDNVDCYFIWLAHHFGETVFEARRLLEGFGGFPGGPGGGPGMSPGAPGPTGKGPKGFPTN
ncbi:MAG TPA: hypothetical protein ENJ09_01650 [Planctomycetes bacterium]|nr:hypothetical protein [Planctomycetota bacterium]